MKLPTARRPLLRFLLPTFALSWSCWFVADHISPIALNLRLFRFSVQIPLEKTLDLVGTCAPGLVVLLLVSTSGKRGLREWWSHVTKWRVPVGYYALAVALPLSIGTLAVIAHVEAGGSVRFAGPWYLLLLSLLISIPQSPFWEEIGWRGYLLSVLQHKRSGFSASLIVGSVWGIWHLPLRFDSAPAGTLPVAFFPIFVLYVTGLSVIFAWLYNRTHGALPVVILLHATTNVLSYALLGPSPEDQLRLFLWICGSVWIAALSISWATSFTLDKGNEYAIERGERVG